MIEIYLYSSPLVYTHSPKDGGRGAEYIYGWKQVVVSVTHSWAKKELGIGLMECVKTERERTVIDLSHEEKRRLKVLPKS